MEIYYETNGATVNLVLHLYRNNRWNKKEMRLREKLGNCLERITFGDDDRKVIKNLLKRFQIANIPHHHYLAYQGGAQYLQSLMEYFKESGVKVHANIPDFGFQLPFKK